MADQSADPYSVLGGDPAQAQKVQVLTQALAEQRRRALLGVMSGVPSLAQAGGDMYKSADRDMHALQFEAPGAQLTNALHAQEVQTGKAKFEALTSPEYAAAAREFGYELGAPQGSLEGVPAASLEHLNALREKLAQAREQRAYMAALFGAKQSLIGWGLKKLPSGASVYFNSHTGETRSVGPNGEMGQVLSPGRAISLPGALGVQPPGAPQAAPGASQAPPQGPGATPAPAPAQAPRRALPKTLGGPQLQGPTGVAPEPTGEPAPYVYNEFNRRNQALGASFDPNHGGGELGANQKRLNAADRVLTVLVDPATGQPHKDISRININEAASAVASLISGGSVAALGMVQRFEPHTLGLDAAKVAEYVTGNPQLVSLPGFVDMFANIAQREKGTIGAQMDRAFQTGLGKHLDFLQHNFADAQATLATAGYELERKWNGKRYEYSVKATRPPGVVNPGGNGGGGNGKIRVKRKRDGVTGSVPASQFDPALYEKLQ